MLTVSVLGVVEAYRDDVRLELPGGKTTEVLARLALDPGRPARVDLLLEDFWGGPRAPANTLQSKISQLRQALGDRDAVAASSDSYILAVPPEAVDAFRVARLAAGSAAARAAGTTAAVAERALEGLSLFREPCWRGVGDWAAPHRDRLEEVRLGLVEDAKTARVELGAGGEVVAELRSLVEQHPLREGLWAALIKALYQSGRQAEALSAFAAVRQLLDDELGVDPGMGLQALHQQVLQHSPELESSGPRTPGNLPPVETPTIGRDEDVAAVLSAVGRAPPGDRGRSGRSGQDQARPGGCPPAQPAGRGMAGPAGCSRCRCRADRSDAGRSAAGFRR